MCNLIYMYIFKSKQNAGSFIAIFEQLTLDYGSCGFIRDLIRLSYT